MAEGNEQISNTRKKQKNKMDFDSIYEQLLVEHSALLDNKEFWIRKGNSQKYTCTLCNISIQISSNVNVVKSALLNHIGDKYHRKRYDVQMSKDKTKEDDKNQEHITETLIDKEACNKEDQNTNTVQKFGTVLVNDSVINENKNKVPKETFENIDVSQKLANLEKVYQMLDGSNPVTKPSKKLIKEGDGIHYKCKLCKVNIFNSSNLNKLKYNLWVHINSETHMKKLPTFSKIQDDCNKLINNLFKNLPSSLRGDIKYFEMGPVFRFVKCSLCETAVSVNAHRFENHIRGEEHMENRKMMASGGESLILEPLSDRTRKAFRKLVVKIDGKFRKDIKYIQIGKMPGYVVCTLCANVALPTQYYVQTHFESKCHVKNRAEEDALKSRVEVNLEGLMSTLPDDLKDYNIFEENICGLTCLRCNDSLPATSYDLYSHIMKERQKYL